MSERGRSVRRGRRRRRGAGSTVGYRLRVASLSLVAVVGAATVFAVPSPGDKKSNQGEHSRNSSGKHDSTKAADTVFLDGDVLLYPKSKNIMSTETDWARAVAIKGERIAYAGTNKGAEKYIGPDTEVVDLDGKMLMPGLGDGHFHSGSFGEQVCHMGYEGGTVDQILAKLKACLLRDDQVGMLTTNFALEPDSFNVNGMIPAGTAITRHDLDRLSKDPSEDEFGTGTTRPIVIGDMGGHQFFTNTQAIVNAGLDENTVEPPGAFIGRDPDGYPNGQFADFSADFGPSPAPTPDGAYQRLVSDYQRLNEVGITMALHPGFSLNGPRFQRLAEEGNLTIRANQAIGAFALRGETDPAAVDAVIDNLNQQRAAYNGLSDPASPGDLTVDTVKMFCDGVAEFPGQTAAMLEPYNVNIGTPENPVFVPGTERGEDPSCEDAQLGYDKLDEAKWSIHTHAIGDRAVRVTLDNYEAAEKTNPGWDRRHTITHNEFVSDQDVGRFGELGVVASMSSVWFQRDMWTVTATEGFIAEDSMDDIYPAGGIVRGGGVLAIGNDWPVTPPFIPWTAIEQVTTREGRENPAQAIFAGQLTPHHMLPFPTAVKAGTIGVAYQMHRDDEVGSIREGYLADLIVIDKNLRPLFKVSKALKRGETQARNAHMQEVFDANVASTKTLMTMVGGEVVYSDPGFPVP